jgi:hypothetical protein
MRWGIQRKLTDNETGSLDDLVEAVLAELPLRSIATMSPSLGFAGLDRMIASLNNDLRGVLRPRGPIAGTTAAGETGG